MHIEEIKGIDERLLAAIRRLLPQLSPGSAPPTEQELAALLASGTTRLFAARDDGPDRPVIGVVVLVSYQALSGRLSRIEDLVVDREERGQGVGRALCEAAIQAARSAGSKAVDLTSNPKRRAANRLYQALGFARGRTNVYRLWLEPDGSGSASDG